MRRALAPHLEMLLVVLIWGGNFSASKIAFPEIPPLAFTALRFVAGSALLWLIVRRVEPEAGETAQLVRPILLLGLVGNTLYQLCFITGLARTTATNSALILTAMPTVLTVTAGSLGLERITRRQRWALGLATAGVLAVVASRGLDLARGDWRGDLLILGAVGCWTAYTLGLRQMGPRMSALRLTAWTMLAGTPGLVLAGLPALSTVQWRTVSGPAWAGLVYSTLLSLVAAYLLWSRAVQRIGPSRAALYTCGTPLVATAVAAALLGERPTMAHLLGGVLILGGVVLGNTGPTRAVPPEG